MNRLLVVTNSLLAVIAVCLVLLVVKMYDFEVIPSAYAAPVAAKVQKVELVNIPEHGLPMMLTNASLPVSVSQKTPVPVQVFYLGPNGYNDWQGVKGMSGALATTR